MPGSAFRSASEALLRSSFSFFFSSFFFSVLAGSVLAGVSFFVWARAGTGPKETNANRTAIRAAMSRAMSLPLQGQVGLRPTYIPSAAVVMNR